MELLWYVAGYLAIGWVISILVNVASPGTFGGEGQTVPVLVGMIFWPFAVIALVCFAGGAVLEAHAKKASELGLKLREQKVIKPEPGSTLPIPHGGE